MRKFPLPLLLGDWLTLAIVTLIGFATHNENGLALLPRLLASLLPLLLGWSLSAALCGLYQPGIISDARQWWRPGAAMVLGGPLAALLRALLLNTTVIPVFGLVLSGTSALGLLAWRAIWRLRTAKRPTV